MSENEDKKPKVVVDVVDFGPLRITGNMVIKDLQRNKESTPSEVSLCRCGRSADKPYCDDSCKK
jgi:CDGSH iron-sulfur domain-containing protein 3